MADRSHTSITNAPVKVKSPSFYQLTPQPKSKSGGSNLPLYSVLILVGVAIVFVLRNRTTTIEGPVLTLIPSNDTDHPAYANMTQAVHALSGQVANLPAHPPGGASTPMTSIEE